MNDEVKHSNVVVNNNQPLVDPNRQLKGVKTNELVKVHHPENPDEFMMVSQAMIDENPRQYRRFRTDKDGAESGATKKASKKKASKKKGDEE